MWVWGICAHTKSVTVKATNFSQFTVFLVPFFKRPNFCFVSRCLKEQIKIEYHINLIRTSHAFPTFSFSYEIALFCRAKRHKNNTEAWHRLFLLFSCFVDVVVGISTISVLFSFFYAIHCHFERQQQHFPFFLFTFCEFIVVWYAFSYRIILLCLCFLIHNKQWNSIYIELENERKIKNKMKGKRTTMRTYDAFVWTLLKQ